MPAPRSPSDAHPAPLSARRGLRLALLALLLLPSIGGADEGRRVRRIPVPERTPAAERYAGDLALPTREQCEAAAREIVAAYGPRTLEPYLSARFPYREEFVVALDRVGLDTTSIALEVESVERVEVGPWIVVRKADPLTVRGECLLDLRTRLRFDDPATGERVVGPVGRGEWRVELLQEVEP